MLLKNDPPVREERKMKRTLAFALAMVMILAVLPFQVFAVELPFVEFDEQPKEVASYEWDETKTPPTCTATFGEEGKEPVATSTVSSMRATRDS